MVLFDATMLSLLFHSGAKAPTDANGRPISRARDRIEHLVETLEKSKTKIIIPTPALAELLVLAGSSGPKYIEEIEDKAFFKVSDFDKRAAIEVSLQIRDAMTSGGKRAGSTSTWAKIKFDRQIVAIAKVEGVTTIYSDDGDLTNYEKAQGLDVKGINDLPLPPMKQEKLL